MDRLEMVVASATAEYLAERVIAGVAVINIETGEVCDRAVATPEWLSAAQKALSDHIYAETV